MSETTPTTGVAREARTLNGCDVGRQIEYQCGDDLFSTIGGTITSVAHHEYWTDITIGPGPATTFGVHPHDMVTIRGRAS